MTFSQPLPIDSSLHFELVDASGQTLDADVSHDEDGFVGIDSLREIELEGVRLVVKVGDKVILDQPVSELLEGGDA